MEVWMKISLLLCIYGFLREFRPSEPFLTDFLSGEWRNITTEQITKDVYPYGTYSYLAQLVIAFLITDMLRYKPLIVVSACVGCVIWSMLLWTYTLEGLQAIEVLYGTFMATEVAYYTYIYAKVDREKFQKVTGFTKAATLAGRFLSAVLAQLLVSFEVMDFRDLNYLSLGAQVISLFWAIALPAVGASLYFNTIVSQETTHTENDEKARAIQTNVSLKTKFSPKRAINLLWTHFKESYTDPIVIQWSVWWALAMCGFTQVITYVQLLWQQINPDNGIYNGATEAALTLLGIGGAFAAGYINSSKFDRWDLWILTSCSALEGLLLLGGALTGSIWVAYITYVLFGMLYYFMITVASVNVAKRLKDDSFAMVFGINTLLALAIQSLLTVAVISENGFELGPRDQFVAYASYFMALAVIYGVTAVVKLIWNCFGSFYDK